MCTFSDRRRTNPRQQSQWSQWAAAARPLANQLEGDTVLCESPQLLIRMRILHCHCVAAFHSQTNNDESVSTRPSAHCPRGCTLEAAERPAQAAPCPIPPRRLRSAFFDRRQCRCHCSTTATQPWPHQRGRRRARRPQGPRSRRRLPPHRRRVRHSAGRALWRAERRCWRDRRAWRMCMGMRPHQRRSSSCNERHSDRSRSLSLSLSFSRISRTHTDSYLHSIRPPIILQPAAALYLRCTL